MYELEYYEIKLRNDVNSFQKKYKACLLYNNSV